MIHNTLNIVAIDDVELRYLTLLLDNQFHSENYITTITTKCNPQGRVSNKVSNTSEYHIVHAKNKENLDKIYINKIDGASSDWVNFQRTGTNSRRHERPLRFYPIFFKENELILPNIEEYKKIYNSESKDFDDEYLDNLIKKYNDKGYDCVLPQLSDGSEYLVWQREFNRALKEIHTYKNFNGVIKTPSFDKEIPKTLWDSNLYANPEYGSELVKEILGFSIPGNTAKSVFTVKSFLEFNLEKYSLDYFAGSGTTAHATIKLNREDQGDRKYILVEMGTYFNSVTKPRVQKVVYTDSWKNGKPQDTEGISQIVKYQVLESYEDTLNNLFLTQKDLGKLGFDEEAQEEYLLKYMLDVESREHLFDIEIFRNPFDYKLKVTENNELISTKVDLVETFNYLIGLYVEHVQRTKDIKFVEGTTREGEKTLIIWRNLETTSNKETEEVFRKLFESERTSEFHQIYINGDHNLSNFRTSQDQFKVKMIEETFFNKMFNVNNL